MTILITKTVFLSDLTTAIVGKTSNWIGTVTLEPKSKERIYTGALVATAQTKLFTISHDRTYAFQETGRGKPDFFNVGENTYEFTPDLVLVGDDDQELDHREVQAFLEERIALVDDDAVHDLTTIGDAEIDLPKADDFEDVRAPTIGRVTDSATWLKEHEAEEV